MKLGKTKANLVLIAGLIFVTTATAAQARRNPAIDQAINNANRASDALVSETVRTLRYHRVRDVQDHRAYRAAKNLDNEIERLHDAWDDGKRADRLISKLRQVNQELRSFEYVAGQYRINRSVYRSLQWTQSSVQQLNGFAQRYIENNRRGHDRDRYDDRDRRDRHPGYGHGRDRDRWNRYRDPRYSRGYGYRYGYGYRQPYDSRSGRQYYRYH